MTTRFIADLHLDASRPDLVDRFAAYCANDARDASRLFILGDLFEAWIGDDDDAPLATQVADIIRTRADAGTAVFFQHGNRDFLLGDAYARRCGMTLLPEEHVIDLDGERVLLMHGDSLCTGDVAYQQFRAQSRHPAWQQAMLSRSLAERRAFAAQARNASREHVRENAATIMDVADDAVHAAMRRHGVRRLIHGHTHRPATHAFALAHAIAVECTSASREVLPDW